MQLKNGIEISENNIKYNVVADMEKARSTDMIWIVQYDTASPIVCMTLISNGQQWIPPEGSKISVCMGKPDRHGVKNDALGVDNSGNVYFTFTRQMTAASGAGTLSLEIVFENSTKYSAPISVGIKENPVTDEMIESTDEYKSLEQILSEVETLSESAAQSQQQAAASEAAAAQSAAEAKAAAESIGIDDNTVSATKLWSSEKSVASFAPLSSALKVSGTGDGLVNLTPTVPWYFQGLKLYGKTTQDGTPSPENPVPLVSAGDSGQIDCSVIGINRMNYAAIPENGRISNCNVSIDGDVLTATAIADGDMFFGGSINTNVGADYSGYEQLLFPVLPGESLKIVSSNSYFYTPYFCFYSKEKKVVSYKSGSTATVPDGAAYATARIGRYNAKVSDGPQSTTFMVCRQEYTGDFVPFQGVQTLTYATPNGLPGVPVSSGGNYTDESGKQWICDEVDFDAGTYTQRCKEFELLSSLKWSLSNNGQWIYITVEGLAKATGSSILSNYFSRGSWSSGKSEVICLGNGSIPVVGVSVDDFETVDALKTWLDEKKQAGAPCYCVAHLEVPVVSKIPAETLAVYAALQSYTGTTNILAEGCGIEATAIADAQTVIAGITDRLSALEQNAIGG